jgi:hypothetical protein
MNPIWRAHKFGCGIYQYVARDFARLGRYIALRYT